MKNAITLRDLYNMLQGGAIFGEYDEIHSKYFSRVLWAEKSKKRLYWCNYGLGAENNTQKSLEWTLKNIFRMTPEEFYKKHEIYKGDC